MEVSDEGAPVALDESAYELMYQCADDRSGVTREDLRYVKASKSDAERPLAAKSACMNVERVSVGVVDQRAPGDP